MMKKFVVDTHTHTIVSGHAYSTLIENCEEAYKKGIKVLGATEHGPAMPGGPHIFYFGDMKVIPDYINNVRVLKGTEANIIDFEGHLDIDVDRLERLELVIASLHDVCMPKGSSKDNTRALIGAMKSRGMWI
jgi:putative hydrolase